MEIVRIDNGEIRAREFEANFLNRKVDLTWNKDWGTRHETDNDLLIILSSNPEICYILEYKWDHKEEVAMDIIKAMSQEQRSHTVVVGANSVLNQDTIKDMGVSVLILE